MNHQPDPDRLTPVEQMLGDDDSDTRLLLEMMERAEAYISSFNWCPPIADRLIGCGIGGIVAVFLFRFVRKIKDTDDQLWVVVGDLPSAYMVTDDLGDGAEALLTYCDLMEGWAHAVLDGSPLKSEFPVDAAATPGNAIDLLSRLKYVRDEVVPWCRAGWQSE
jgi:hypothetical protein